MYMVIASVEPTHWCTSFSRHVWFPPNFPLCWGTHPARREVRFESKRLILGHSMSNGLGRSLFCEALSRCSAQRQVCMGWW